MTETADELTHRIHNEFAERLDMLEEAEQITTLARRLTELALADLSVSLGLRFTEDNASQFVTHLAIALARINRGEDAIAMSAVVADEIEGRDREVAAVSRVMRDCEKLLDRSIPESEVAYMTVHLCAMVDEQEAP